MSITKNRQNPGTLHTLAKAAFPDRQALGFTELTEGMFNAAYRCDFADGTACILKVAPGDISGLLSNEVSLMRAEVSAMQLLREAGETFVPAVLFSDFSCTLCGSPYFFMEVVPGGSMSSRMGTLTEDTVSAVMHEAGRLQARLSCIRGDRFGLGGDVRRFDTQAELVRYMLTNVLGDAARVGLSFGFTQEELLARLERDAACFDEVRTPSLVHMDMWEGNIFVHEGRLSGVIDWERVLWGDPLMDDRFRWHNRPRAFLEGYGKTDFTPAERRRLRWYDVYLQLTMLTESIYRQSEDEGMARWLRQSLAEAWAELEAPAAE